MIASLDSWTGSFADWADRTARYITAVSNPTLDYDARPHKDWPLMRLDHALYVAAAYLLLVAVGVVRKSLSKTKPKRPAADDNKATPAPTLGAVLRHPAAHFPADPVKRFQVFYNAAQVCLSAYMAVAAAYYAYRNGYPLVCAPFEPQETGITFVCWLFFVSKAVDYLDTVFMVLRGNWQQFSFLHTYHHLSIFATYWWVTNTAYTGDVFAPVLANAIIHTIMYFYFWLTSFGVRPWWGRLLTQMQMLQFVLMMVQGAVGLYMECPYPSRVMAFYVAYIAFMLLLFANFFVRKHCAARRTPASGAALEARAQKKAQ